MDHKRFMFLLIIIGFVASLTAAAHSIVVEIVYSAATSPYNIGWNGTSKFVEALENLGYEVSVVEDLKSLVGEDKLVLAIIAPESNYTRDDISLLKRLMSEASLKLLIADENYATSLSILKPLFGAELYKGLLATRVSEATYIFSQNVTLTLEGVDYRVVLNRPNAFKEVGELEVIGYSNSTVYSAIIGVEGPPIFQQASYPIVCGWFSGDDGVVVLSDSSLFINLYFDYPEISDNEEYVLSLVEWLTSGDREYKIYIDDSHYTLPSGEEAVFKVQSQVPIPPVGLMIGLMIAAAAKYADYILESILKYGIIPLQIILIGLLSYILFRQLSNITGTKSDDERYLEIEEAEVVAETPILRRTIKGGSLPRREYVRALSTLYEIIKNVLFEELGLDLDSALEGMEPHNTKLKKLLGPPHSRVYEKLKFMKRTYESTLKGERRLLPLTLNWKKIFQECVRSSEEIVNRLGYSILGERGKILWRRLWSG